MKQVCVSAFVMQDCFILLARIASFVMKQLCVLAFVMRKNEIFKQIENPYIQIIQIANPNGQEYERKNGQGERGIDKITKIYLKPYQVRLYNKTVN